MAKKCSDEVFLSPDPKNKRCSLTSETLLPFSFGWEQNRSLEKKWKTVKPTTGSIWTLSKMWLYDVIRHGLEQCPKLFYGYNYILLRFKLSPLSVSQFFLVFSRKRFCFQSKEKVRSVFDVKLHRLFFWSGDKNTSVERFNPNWPMFFWFSLHSLY